MFSGLTFSVVRLLSSGLWLGALAIAAGMTDTAAAFMLNNAAALRAGAEHCFTLERSILAAVGFFQMLAYGLGNGISAGNHPIIAEAGRLMTADTDKLLNHGFRGHTAAPGQRNQATDCLALAGSAAPGLAHGVEKFKDLVVVIFIDGNIHGAAARGHLVGAAV